ncbi:Rpn family recombination-promoting nuclease/putative transposase [aff. Roholtiella sp. LEGE 12411]|uniref:Rpn family recombination-promoting nuclease/putative transposase n=1 Tax=aff. Roholtiella sp. LEGE 12411 TaxID=1828822 RepID=UPI0018805057|nr:Rpn family recombination-promoting nuclease/putative transposase [aff. Roholtiella sp. LEGE 12411]MBE9036025.1 Rpn family recombination-promoting nuclease/putative transposase [aff. Roholtiella sp. LEGE 12411]
MKTDTIFYTLFQNLPSILFELLEQEAAVATHYQFTSVEIKELSRRLDGLFLPKAEFPQDPIYFVEVQFQRDDDMYWRLVTEAFLYLNQYRPQKSWQAVVLWGKRGFDPGVPSAYQTSLALGQIQIVYLDELADTSSDSIGLGIVKLVVAAEGEAVTKAKNLITQVQQTPEPSRRNLLELVERMLVYKFADKSRQELEAMFGLTQWQQTRFYQEVKEETELETKLGTVPRLLKVGLSVEQIAEALELDIETVQQAVQEHSEQKS